MNSRYLKFLFLLISVTLLSCSDDSFLEEKPESFYTSNNVFSSSKQVKQVVLSLYSDLRNFRLTNLQIKGEGTDFFDQNESRIAGAFADYNQINTQDGRFYTVYAFYYKLISTANTAIDAAGLDNITWDSEQERLYVLAQARFFRAYAHGTLAELFGGVPIVTKLADEPRFDYKRATQEETYQFVIDELTAILDDMPEITNQPGRLVKAAAQHYLSEFYLALGTISKDDSDFKKSIKYASDVIDGGKYSLMTERFGTRADEPGKNVWWDLFRKGNINYADGNKESIWTFQTDLDAYIKEDHEAYLNYPRYYMPVLRAIPGVNGIGADVGGRGVAWESPTTLVKDAIWKGNLEESDERNASYNIQRTFYYNDPDKANFGDPVPQEVVDKANKGQGWIFPIFWKLSTDHLEGLDQGQNGSNLFRDDYAIRLPETILLRAEAYYRMGNSAKAAQDINMIRNRVNATPINADAVDIDFILDERARELYVEENRWSTLLRMGGTVAVDRIRKYALHDLTRKTLTFDFNLWPIPQDVIDRNKDVKLEQNPGWN
jgi:hypothetical protein